MRGERELRPLASRERHGAVPFKERCAEALFHQPNAFAGRCQRHTRPRGTMRDTCSLDHKQKQTQIDQIEAQGKFS